MQIEVISDYSAFQKIKPEWNELADNFPSPLLRHEWIVSCLRTLYPKHARPNMIVARCGSKLRAAAPLISVRQAGLRQLVMPGGNILHEPCGFLYDSEAALLEIVHAALALRMPLSLPRFNAETPIALTLKQRRVGSIHFAKSGSSSLRVPLKSTWAEFEASMSSRRRSHLRSYRRHAEHLGKIEFEVVHPEVDTLTPYLEEFFRLEASGWKGREGTAALMNPHVHRFYCDYARSAALIGMLRFFLLKSDGKTIAARIMVEHGKRLWELKIAYDEAWRKCMPGILLTHEVLRYAVEKGLEAYEFLGQAEAWEHHWPCQEDEYVSMRVYPLSLTGQISLVRDVCDLAWREGSRVMREHLNGPIGKALQKSIDARSLWVSASKAKAKQPDLYNPSASP